jgi:hypothetical protein
MTEERKAAATGTPRAFSHPPENERSRRSSLLADKKLYRPNWAVFVNREKVDAVERLHRML